MSEPFTVIPRARSAELPAGFFRLAGFGGAALFLRSAVLPPELPDAPARLGIDIGLLTPHALGWLLSRPASPGLAERLSAFFLAAAADWHPEATLPAFADDVLGLRLVAESSDDQAVTLVVRVREDRDDEAGEDAGIEFTTSRVALATAAGEVRALASADAEAWGAAEPPVEWSTP